MAKTPRGECSTEMLVDADDGPLAGTPYRKVQKLGMGGMGTVYSAQHRELGNIVAVKVLHIKPARAESQLRRLDRGRIEAQLGARLRDENLVAVHGYGFTAHGTPYLAMEYLKGKTLHEMLRDVDNGPLPLCDALDLVCQALHGLQVVHNAGMVHRDVTPANLFVTHNGTVKVLDLGCAKVVETVTITPDALAYPTAEGTFIGSPRYMAPEQASLSPVDRRADIYAIALVLYRLLTGRGPFDDAATFDELRQAQIHQVPVPASSHLQSPLPPALDELLLRCLAKNPDARPASAEAMAAELRRIEVDARQTLGDEYITDTIAPPTTMGERRMWQRDVPPSPAASPRGNMSVRQLLLVMVTCLVMGMLLGGFIVGFRSGG